MPLVLVENEVTVSGHAYDDQTGVTYEFPDSYRGLVRPGECFVYYRGRQTRSGRRQPQVYFGTGIIGELHLSSTKGRLRCDILDYLSLPEPVPFRTSTGYYEPVPSPPGYYFVKGVRLVDDQVYNRILMAAGLADLRTPDDPPGLNSHGRQSDSELRRRIEDYAVTVALAYTHERFPGEQVDLQVRNNPGFDILVAAGQHYCEVKGSLKGTPVFFISEGERQFSHAHAARYTLVVVYDIDLEGSRHRVAVHDGAVGGDDVRLQPTQWAGRLDRTIGPAPPAVGATEATTR